MALVKCGECKREISDRAVACPQCGAPLDAQEVVVVQRKKPTSVLTWIGTGLFALMLYSCLRESDNSPSSTSVSVTPETEWKVSPETIATWAARVRDESTAPLERAKLLEAIKRQAPDSEAAKELAALEPAILQRVESDNAALRQRQEAEKIAAAARGQ